jgi:hypothetical protein
MGRRRTLRRVQRTRSKDDLVQKKSSSQTSGLQRLTELQKSIGSQAVQRLINSSYIQTKLQVSSPEDQSEKEADQSAKAVMRSPASGGPSLGGPPISNPTNESGQGANDTSRSAHQNLESKLETGGNPRPLPDEVRGFMESRLDADLSGVRVHTDSDASQMSKQAQAEAFTHGQDVYYGAGKSPRNDELTAHELTHVIQQTGRVPLQKNGAVRAGSEGAPSGVEPLIQRSCEACNADDKGEQSVENRGQSPNTPTQVLALQRADAEVQQQKQDQDLQSPRFAGDPLLEACLNDKARLGMGARGDSVRKIQQALTDLGRMPPSSVDGIYGSQTSNAVRQFKVDEQLTPSTFGDVGPKTMARLDQIFSGGGGGLLPPCLQGPDVIVAGGDPRDFTNTAFVGATPVSAALIPGVTCQLVRPPVSPFPPTQMADLSPGETARMVVTTTSTLQTEIDAAYIPFRAGSTVRNTATIAPALTFGTSVPADGEVRQGLVRVASTLRNSNPPSLVRGTTQTVAVNDQPLQPVPQAPPSITIAVGIFPIH